MNQPITLTNLTPEQVDMLDIMWSLDSEQEFSDWQACLDDDELRMCEDLMKLLIQEAWDQMITADLTEAQQVLKRFML